MRSTILLSGGMDSAACLAFALARSESVEALHVQYGQAAAAMELAAAKSVCEHYGTTMRVVELGKPYETSDGYLSGRNLLLLSGALTQRIDAGLLYLGFHLDTDYPDCGAPFLDASQRIVDVYHAGTVQLIAPFLQSRKAELAAYCVEHAVPVEVTYSCEAGQQPPCGKCLSCRDRRAVGV